MLHNKLSLKVKIHLLPPSLCGPRVCIWLHWALCFGVSHKVTTKYLGAEVSPESSPRKEPTTKLTRLFTRFSFSQAVGLRALVPCWQLAEAALNSPSQGTLWHVSFICACKPWQQKRRSTCNTKVTVLRSRITERTSHRFCPMLLGNVPGPTHTQGHRHQESGIMRTILESVCHVPHLAWQKIIFPLIFAYMSLLQRNRPWNFKLKSLPTPNGPTWWPAFPFNDTYPLWITCFTICLHQ